jgi:hypothetical protein
VEDFNMTQQQTINETINGLVQMLTTHAVQVPASLVNADKLSDKEILDRLILLVQDYNLEYEIVGNGAILKPLVRRAYLCQSQMRSNPNV